MRSHRTSRRLFLFLTVKVGICWASLESDDNRFDLPLLISQIFLISLLGQRGELITIKWVSKWHFFTIKYIHKFTGKVIGIESINMI